MAGNINVSCTVANTDSAGISLGLLLVEPRNRAFFEYREQHTVDWLLSSFLDKANDGDFEIIVDTGIEAGNYYEFKGVYGKDSPNSYGQVETFAVPLDAIISVNASDTNAGDGVPPLIDADPYTRYYFEYKASETDEWNRTELQTGWHGENFEREVTGLDPALAYDYKAAFSQGSPVYFGEVLHIDTRTVDVDDILPACVMIDAEGIPSKFEIMIQAGVINSIAKCKAPTVIIEGAVIKGYKSFAQFYGYRR